MKVSAVQNRAQNKSNMNKVTKFYTEQLSQLVGSKVKSVVNDGKGFFGLEIIFPNKEEKVIWFLQDDEGNGPGSFEINGESYNGQT